MTDPYPDHHPRTGNDPSAWRTGKRVPGVRLAWPTPETLAALSGADQLVELRREFDRLRGRAAELLASSRTLEQAARDAATLDNDAAAAALRRGQAMPKPVHGPKVAAQQQEAAREFAATQTATAQTARDVLALLDAQRSTFEAEADAAIDEARQDAATEFDKFAARLGRLARLRALKRWLARPDKAAGVTNPTVPGLRAPSGADHHLSFVVDTLSAMLVAEPATVEPPTEQEKRETRAQSWPASINIPAR